MAGEGFPLELVAVGGGRVEGPDLEQVVAAAGDEPAVAGGAGTRIAADDAAGGGGGGPADRVDAQAVGGEGAVLEAVVLELENRHVAVGGGAGQQAPGLVRRPGDGVDAGLVQREVEDALPAPALLPPDEDLAVVAGRGQNVTVLWVRPGDTPYCSFVSGSVKKGRKWKGELASCLQQVDGIDG